MIEYIRFATPDWNRIKKSLMACERACFSGELEMTEEETHECVCAPGAMVYLALDRGKVIGNTYGNLLSTIDEDWFDGYWNPRTYKHDDKKTLYVTSTAVLPKYRNRGIASALKNFMMRDLKRNYFKHVIGHAHAGTMIRMATRFGGKVIKKFPHWYGSPQTHYLYEVDLSKAPVFVDVPRLKQKTFFDCGVASLAVLCKTKFVPEIAYERYGVSNKIGTSHESLSLIAGAFFNRTLHSQYNSSIYDVCRLIDKEKPAIVNYQCDGEGHYSVVCGYDPAHVYIMNVYNAKLEKINKGIFLKLWYSRFYGYRWMAW